MPRKTDAPLEETAISIPLRRSTRKTSVNSPAPSTITAGKATQSQPETVSKTKSALSSQQNGDQEDVVKKQPAARGRRASTTKEESESKPEPIKTRSRRSSATSESAVEEESKTQPITRRRRSSATEELTVSESVKPIRSRRSSASEKSAVEEPAKLTRTRRGSSKDEEPKEEPVKRTTRSRRGSVDKVEEIEPNEKRPNTRRRGSFTDELNSEPEPKAIKLTPVKSRRRPLATENTGNLEPIVELELEVKSRKSNSPIIEKPIASRTAVESPKRTELKTNLNLSIINETTEETLNNEDNKSGEVLTPRRSPRLSKQKSPEELISLTSPSKKIVIMENDEIENVEGTSKSKEEHLKSFSKKLDFQDTENMESKNEENVDQNQTDLLNVSGEQQIQNEAIEIIEEKLEKHSVNKATSCKLDMVISTSQTESVEEREDDLNSSKSSSTSDKENIYTNVFSSPAVKKIIIEEKKQLLVTLTNEDSIHRNSTKEIIKENVQKIVLPLEESSPMNEHAQITKESPQLAKDSPHSVEASPQLIKTSSPSIKESSPIIETNLETESEMKKLRRSEDRRSMSPLAKQSTEERNIKESPKYVSSVKPEEKMFTEKSKVSLKEIDADMSLSEQNKHSVLQEVPVKESSSVVTEDKNEKVEVAYDNLEKLLDNLESGKEASKNSSVSIKSQSSKETISRESSIHHSIIEEENSDIKISKPSTTTCEANLEDKPKSKQSKGHEDTFDSMESPATKNIRISDIEAEVRRSVSPVLRGKSKSPQSVVAEKTLDNEAEEITSPQSVTKSVEETNKAIISYGLSSESSNNLSENSESTSRVQLNDDFENETEEIEQSVTEDIDSRASPPDFKESLKSIPSDDYEFEVPSDEEELEKTHAREYDESTVVASFITSSQIVGDVTVSTEIETVMSFDKKRDSQTSTGSSHFETKEGTSKSELNKETKHNGVKTNDNSVATEENGIEQELETDSYENINEDAIRVRAEVQRIITAESSSSECSENVDASFTDENSDVRKENGNSFSRQSKTCTVESSSSVGDVKDDSVKHNARKVVQVIEDIQLKGKDVETFSNDDKLASKSVGGRINIDLCEEDWEVVEDIKDKNKDGNEISSTKKVKNVTGGVRDTECEADVEKDSTAYGLESEPVKVARNINLCEEPGNEKDENELILTKKSKRVTRRSGGTKFKEDTERDQSINNDDQSLEPLDDPGKDEYKDSLLKKSKKRSTSVVDKEFENSNKTKSPEDHDLAESRRSNQKRKSDEYAKDTTKSKKLKKMEELNMEEFEDVGGNSPKEKIAKKKKLSLKSSKKPTPSEDTEDNENVSTVINKSDIEKLENKTENVSSSESDSEVFKTTKEGDSKNRDSSKRSSYLILDEFISKKLTEMASDEASYEEEEEDNPNEPNDFLCTMAEEGEEDTPSEDSNAIIDEGESVGFSDSDLDSDDEYDKNDSFICDDENEQLLSGEEYDIEDEQPSKKQKSRIIQLDSYDDDIIKIERKEKTTPFKKKRSRIITLSDSSESDEQHEDDNSKDVKTLNENNESQEIIYVADKTNDVILEPKPIAVNQEDSSNLKPDPSPTQHSTKRRLSSITFHENINVREFKNAPLSGRIINIVDGFCTTIHKGEISMNLSIECSAQDSNDSAEEKQGDINVNNLRSASDTPGELCKAVNNDNLNSEEEAAEEQKYFKPPRKLSVSMNDSDLSVSKKIVRKRAKLSKSMDNLNQIGPMSKKRKINKKKNVDKFIVKCPEVDDLSQKDKRLKNRPKRVVKPSTNMSDSWFTEVVHVVPSTSAFDNQEKAAYKAGKVHPKDFRSQMLNDPSRVRRVETRTMLKKKGMYF